MAIYKNREVSINTTAHHVKLPDTVNILYKDGSTETVKIADVGFTDGEKKTLLKDNSSIYENAKVVSDDDVKAVRLGVPPASDLALQEQVKTQAQHKLQTEEHQKRVEDMQKKQEASLNKTVATDKKDK